MRTTRILCVTFAVAAALAAAGAVEAGKPGDCKPIQISDDCVIYDQGFCAYQVLAASGKLKNLDESCGRGGQFHETDFSGLPSAINANWYTVKMPKAKLNNMVLTGINLEEAEIEGADFSGADLSTANLKNAKGNGNTKLNGAKLNQAILDGADLTGVVFDGVEIAGASLKGTVLTNADLSGVVLDGADLSGADLSSAKLTGTGLKGAKLQGAKLTQADLQDADLGDAETDGDTDFSEAVLCNTTMPDGTVDNSGCP